MANVRRFELRDARRVCEIFYQSVHEVGPARYTQAQIDAWAPNVPDFEKWGRRCTEYETFVADNDDGETVGWVAMTPDGYIDMLFCLPEATRRGVGAALYSEVERVASERGLAELTAHASAFAEPFFKKRGWEVRERETVGIGDAAIVRAVMAKVVRIV